jgi:hypothetical protein
LRLPAVEQIGRYFRVDEAQRQAPRRRLPHGSAGMCQRL